MHARHLHHLSVLCKTAYSDLSGAWQDLMSSNAVGMKSLSFTLPCSPIKAFIPSPGKCQKLMEKLLLIYKSNSNLQKFGKMQVVATHVTKLLLNIQNNPW